MAQQHDLFVFTDEIYEYFLYDGRTHVSLATLPGMADRTITIGGYSKTFSITGWRIGYSVAAARWAQAIGAMNDLLYVCAPTPLQAGVAVGIQELPDSFYRDLARAYQWKRDRFCQALAKAGLTPSIPQGAYYVLAGTSHLPGTTGKSGRCTSSRRSAWRGCRVKPSFPGLTGGSSFDSAMQKPMPISTMPVGGLRDSVRNWPQAFRNASDSLDHLSARSPNGK